MGIFRITGTQKISVTATAQDVEIGYRYFLVENLGESAIYLKEKDEDGVAATAANGFAVPPGTVLPHVLTARTLSVIGSAGGDARLLFVDTN